MPSQQAKPGITDRVAGTTMLLLLASAMLSVAAPSAKATPQIAQGKPCNTCHTGSPPTKDNVKK